MDTQTPRAPAALAICTCGHQRRQHGRFRRDGVESRNRCKACGCLAYEALEALDFVLTPEPASTMTEAVLVPKPILQAMLDLLDTVEDELESWESCAGSDEEMDGITEQRAVIATIRTWYETQRRSAGVPLWDV